MLTGDEQNKKMAALLVRVPSWKQADSHRDASAAFAAFVWHRPLGELPNASYAIFMDSLLFLMTHGNLRWKTWNKLTRKSLKI